VPPGISVVLPVFNGEAALPRTVESILGQTEVDFELIVVDDGSTDQTGTILLDYAVRDTRIRVLSQPNAGLTRALIRGCDAARAPLIARQDCGDLSHPDRFRRMRALLEERPSVVVAGCEAAYVGPGGETLYRTTHAARDVRGGLLHADFRDLVSLVGAAAFMRTEAYRRAGGYRAEFYFAQDVDLWIRMAALGEICVCGDVLYDVSVDLRSISTVHRREQMACGELAVEIRDAGDDRQREALLTQAARIRLRKQSFTRRLEAKALYFIAACLRGQNDPRWRAYAARAVRCSPFHVRSWLLLLRG
jgi:glycosyltransferase involved in cell wall biosynthesis